MRTLKLLLTLLLIAPSAHAAETKTKLSFQDYLRQVRKSNQTYAGQLEAREAAQGRSLQADLLTAYKLEASAEVSRDSNQPTNTIMSYEGIDSEAYSFGISKDTTFGLNAKLSYELGSTRYLSGGSAFTDYAVATPKLTLTQSLWQNGSGRLVEANVNATRAQEEANEQTAESALDGIVQDAASAYWNLVASKAIVDIRNEALNLAQAVLDYNSKRARMNLTDKADSLTAKASVETAKLNLQTAQDDERSQLRIFNKLKNAPPEENPGELSLMDWEYLSKVSLPEDRKPRADIMAAAAEAKASEATALAAAEADKPVLEAYAAYAPNGRGSELSSAVPDAYKLEHSTMSVGLRFSMPLEVSTLEKTRKAAELKAQSAKTLLNQKLYDQDATWRDLKAKISEAQNRLKMNENIEVAQREKLNYERQLLGQGRSSTYQVLLYQQDYSNARLARVQAAKDMISLIAQIRLYDGSREEVAQ